MTPLPRLFTGHVMHHRLRPVDNAFVYPVFFCEFPVCTVDQQKSPIFAVDRWHVLSFNRRDHGPRDGSPLGPWIRDLLRRHGLPDDGEIRLQCFPRVFGFVFNPVSFWYCHDAAGQLIAVLASVNNTFGGHHDYLLRHADGRPLRDGDELQAGKDFHVSPFNTVCGSYRFRFRLRPDNRVVHIDYDDGEGPLLLTAIAGKVRPWTSRQLLAAFLRMPLLTFGVYARIHWQALKLWLKGVPFFGKRPPQPLEEPR